jgi:hypothetical protein
MCAPLGAILLLLAVTTGIAQDAGVDARSVSRHDRRRDYEALLALPAPERQRIKQLVNDLDDEDADTQARLLQVARRYATWLERLPAEDRQRVEQAPTSAQRLQLIREIRERQWIATLTPGERERIAAATKRGGLERARQAITWGASLAALGPAPGVALPPLDERQRLIASYRQRERQLELERQFALTQNPDRQEANQRELQRIRKDLLDPNRRRPISNEDRQLLQTTPADGTIAYISTLLDLARKYDVPLPEPPRRLNVGQGLPRVPQPELLDFARKQLNESAFKDFETRLTNPKLRQQALNELTRLYWNAHPAKLLEIRQTEVKKKKEGKAAPE